MVTYLSSPHRVYLLRIFKLILFTQMLVTDWVHHILLSGAGCARAFLDFLAPILPPPKQKSQYISYLGLLSVELVLEHIFPFLAVNDLLRLRMVWACITVWYHTQTE